MKVALLIPTMKLGGAEKIASELSFNLPKDWDIHIIVFENKIEYPCRGIVHSLDLPFERNIFKDALGFVRRIFRFNDFVKKEKIDLVLSFDDYANVLNIIAGVRPIISIHKSIVMADKSKPWIKRSVSRFMRRVFYPRANRIISVSVGIKEELTDYAKINPKKIMVINNPFDIELIRIKAAERPVQDIPGEYIINIGRMEPQKAQWHLIRAFANVKKIFPGMKLVILGRGSLSTYLKKIANDMALSDSVIFIENKIDNIYPILKSAKLLVLTSIFEGFGNVIIESLAIGVPVISTDCRTGPREILMNDGRSGNPYGILIPVPDGEIKSSDQPLTKEEVAMADAILDLLGHEEKRRALSERGKARAEDFDIKLIIPKYIKLMESQERT